MQLDNIWFFGIDAEDLENFKAIFTVEGLKEPFDFNFIPFTISPQSMVAHTKELTITLYPVKEKILLNGKVEQTIFKGSDGRLYFNLGSIIQVMNRQIAAFVAKSFSGFNKLGWFIKEIEGTHILFNAQSFSDEGLIKLYRSSTITDSAN